MVHMRLVVSNCNDNVGQSYYICNSCKINEGGYGSHKTTGFVTHA